MLRYLNLDLLYNIDKYLYPLFYYEDRYSYYKNIYWGINVYCSITKKFIYKTGNGDIHYYDLITKKYERFGHNYFDTINYVITENIFKWSGYIFNKREPFKLSKKDLYFLKSNTRIN